MKRSFFIGIFTISIFILFSLPVSARENEDSRGISAAFEDYRERLLQPQWQWEIEGAGFEVAWEQAFPIEMEGSGEVVMIPAIEEEYHRLALFFAEAGGRIVYRTDQLEVNSRNSGELAAPVRELNAVSFQDINRDGLTDIVMIVTCVNKKGDYAGKPYKIGEALFQGEQEFYRDYRLSDKINRFGMNKSIELITAFVKDGDSTEFLYTAATLEELQKAGLRIISEQCYFRNFEKLGRLQVVPGMYSIADYNIFMIYLVNEQGYIVWSLQPMGEYDNLYALKGINCRDIDGDGLKDIIVLARYSYEGNGHELIVKSDYAVYYQRTGGFSADTEIKGAYRCGEEDTMEEVVENARAYWGWKSEK